MSDLDATLRKFDSLTRRWKPGGERSFQDSASLLTLAQAIKRQAAAEALKLPKGFSREILVRLRESAIEAERNARIQLGRSHAPAPGDAA